MLQKLRNNVSAGWQVLRTSNSLLFVAVLIFVFPLLFLYITQSFFQTAYSNIETSEKRRIGLLHDSLAQVSQVASTSVVQTLSENIVADNPNITEVRLLEKTPEGLLILTSLQKEKIQTVETMTAVFDTTQTQPGSTFIHPFTINGERVWQATRNLRTPDGRELYLFSEHSFAELDSVMVARRQQSYLGLTAIFLFLMMLAYWFAKQIDWKKRYYALEAQLQERDLFTNMIAHEFRAPLTVINGYVSFLMESQSIHQAERRFVTNIQSSTLRLLALVNDFLEVARIQSGKMNFEVAECDIRNVLKGVVDSNMLTATKKGLTLSYVPGDTPLLHKTDAKRFAQILQNMISNAIKYTEKGSVEIVAEQNALETVIRIKDTGMGIDASDQHKLFAPFARVGGVEKTNITGTGLGMWITKQMIGLLKGDISIESIKGVGTHVIITLKR